MKGGVCAPAPLTIAWDDARASTTPALGRSHRPGEAIVISEVNPARMRERWYGSGICPLCDWEEDPMTVPAVLDAAGRRRSPATMPGYHAGRAPRNKGQLYPADPPTVEEVVAVMRAAAHDRHGWRLRALIVVLWRGGLRVREALMLGERDLDPRRGSLLVCNGKGGRRREIGMDAWGWEQLRPWLAAHAGIRRRFAPHQLRHAHAVELAREGVPVNIIQRQLGHASLGTTSIYLQGIDTEENIATVHARRGPMMSATAGRRL
jgi:integrase